MAATLLLSRDDRQERAIYAGAAWSAESRWVGSGAVRSAASRWSSSERQRASVETTTSRAPETVWKYLSTCRKRRRILGPGVSVVDARIPCMATVFDDPRGAPGRGPVAAVPRRPATRSADPRLWSMSAHRDSPTPSTALAAVAAPAHRARAPASPTTPTASTSAPPPVPPTPAAYWANTTRQTKRDAKRRLELAHALDCDHEPVRDAMAAGTRVRGAGGGDREGCRRAPGRAPPRRRGPPDRRALPQHDPVALRRLAHQVLEVVAPEIAEAHELKALQRQEALAEEACRFTIADDGHGLCHGRFTLPSQVGAMSSRRCSRSTRPSTGSTPAPRRGSGTRSASTSPATRSTGSPRPAAWTPRSWSP